LFGGGWEAAMADSWKKETDELNTGGSKTVSLAEGVIDRDPRVVCSPFNN